MINIKGASGPTYLTYNFRHDELKLWVLPFKLAFSRLPHLTSGEEKLLIFPLSLEFNFGIKILVFDNEISYPTYDRLV